MKLVFINQHYIPDIAPTGAYLADLACSLAAKGHDVTVICSMRSYDGNSVYRRKEVIDGVKIERVWSTGWNRARNAGRILNYLSFYISLFLKIIFFALKERVRGPRGDSVYTGMTTPPFAGVVARFAAALSGGSHAHWVMDMYPDVLVPGGILCESGCAATSLLLDMLRRLAAWQFAGSCSVFTIDPDMALRLASYTGMPGTADDWVPLWVRRRPDDNSLPVDGAVGRSDVLNIMYSGNMGAGHRFSEFLEAARILAGGNDGVRMRWVFAGSGKRLAEIRKFAGDHPEAGIELADYVPQTGLLERLRSADVHLLSMDSGWRGCISPSKLQAVFGVGRPVIYAGPVDSATARWIRESGGGWVVAEGDVQGMIEAVKEACDPGERLRRGEKACVYARKKFDMDNNISRLCRGMFNL